jgi:hypothetical protein
MGAARGIPNVVPTEFVQIIGKPLNVGGKIVEIAMNDLQHVDLSTDESVKVSLIDVEIVSPLPNSRSFLVRLEIRRHLIRRHWILIRRLPSIGESCASSESHTPNVIRQRNRSTDSQLWTCHQAVEKRFHCLDCRLQPLRSPKFYNRYNFYNRRTELKSITNDRNGFFSSKDWVRR